MPVRVQANPERSAITLSNPPRSIQQNVQPFGRLAESTENHFRPISHEQNPLKLTRNAVKARFLCKFKVEAADAPLEIFETKKASIRAAVSNI
jgi:hypothetical protein